MKEMEDNKNMIMSTMKMFVTDENKEDVLHTLTGILERIKVEKGCISYCLNRDIENANTLFIVEMWKDIAHFKRFQRSEYFRIILSVIELLNSPPELMIYSAAEMRSLNFLTAVRD